MGIKMGGMMRSARRRVGRKRERDGVGKEVGGTEEERGGRGGGTKEWMEQLWVGGRNRGNEEIMKESKRESETDRERERTKERERKDKESTRERKREKEENERAQENESERERA